MAKMTFKKEQIIAAYAVIKNPKLGKVDTVADKFKIVDALREMRPIVKAHDEDMKSARETLRPEALAEIENRIKSGAEVSQMDMIRSTILNNEYNEALGKYVDKDMAEEVEINLTPLSKECVNKLIEGNPDWTPEQIMALIDVLG